MAITKIQSESLNLADNYDFTGTVTGAGESNTPSFHAYGSNPVLSNNTDTKLVMANTYFNIGSGYDTSNYRFTVPSGQGGKYFFYSKFRIEADNGHIQIVFRKNGTEIDNSKNENGYSVARYFGVNTAFTVDLNATDYIETYAYINVGNTNGLIHPHFLGFKLHS